MKKGFFCLSLVPLLLAACRSDVARVGSVPISERDLARRMQVSECYYPGSGQRYVALSQLIKGYLSLEVLKALGHRVEEKTLQEEDRRIDRETQAPELLRKIKDIYQGDREAYLQSFVRTVYAERVLYHETFLPSPAIHQKQRSQAEALLQGALQAPASFPEIARNANIEVVQLRISAEGGIRPAKGRVRQEASPSGAHLEEAQRIIGYLSRLRPGQVFREVIEWQEGYQVLRLLRKEGRDWVVQSASIPKRDYEEWFWEQAAKIPVHISDAALKEELLKEVAWARHLRLE